MVENNRVVCANFMMMVLMDEMLLLRGDAMITTDGLM